MATTVKEDIKHQKRKVDDSAENGNVDEKDSTTAGVFSTLDESEKKLLLKIKILSLVVGQWL
jgi:hypothetical protein